MKALTSILLITLLSGCSTLPSFGWGKKKEPEPLPPKIVTVTETVPLDIYQPPMPQEISLENVKFFVITKKNLEEKYLELSSKYDGSKFIVVDSIYQIDTVFYKSEDVKKIKLRN